ncbi:MAG: RNA methyltransferase [Deltaproteobacteria bacterium]|nr:RNA methyltransferase [Deltaproteobacteria bacterium]
MGPHKVRLMMKAERDMAARRFRRQRNKNYLAKPGIHECAIVLDHLKPSYNIGKIFRSAEAFGTREIHLVGIDFFDPAPGMGAFKWIPAIFHKTFFSCYTNLINKGYALYVLEPGKGQSIAQTNLPKKSAFILGHEEFGISFEPNLFPGIECLNIPQFGKSQSLNVSVAGSIILYEYIRQHGRIDKKNQGY